MTTKLSNKQRRELSKDVEDVETDSFSIPVFPPTSTSNFIPDQHFREIIPDSIKSTSNLLTGKEAREALMRGVNLVADAFKLTLGAAGANGIIENVLLPYHEVTNDGVSIAESIHPTDPYEKIGANLIKEIATRANKESGDGTTTAVVLAQAILKEGMNSTASPMEIKRSLDECLPLIYETLDKQSKDVDVNTISQVASISAEDETIGKLIQEIYQQIGKDGIIEPDNSNTNETYYEIKEGIRLRNCGYIASYMANSGVKSIHKKPKILIAKQKIATLQDVDPLFQKLSGEGTTELVIFCDEIDPTVLSALAFTHIKGIFKTLIIKAPRLWKDWIFEDFAKITGATMVSPETGVTFKNVELSHLGTCDKLLSTKEETTVIGIKDISEHIAQLEQESNTNDQLKVRLAWLKTRAAVLKLGANSESELSYKRLKLEDAINASSLALKGGVVPGGGVALMNVQMSLPASIGGEILKKALTSPFYQIISNAGVPTKDFDRLSDNGGFDAKQNKVVDMWDAGIIDPTLVVKNSVKAAISVAGTVLTTKIVTILNKDKEDASRQLR